MGSQRSPAVGGFYHIYNRGTEKREIFPSNTDRDRFVALLYLANGTVPVHLENFRRAEQGLTLLKLALEMDRGKPLIDIAAYCLMPNHFHLLVRELSEGGTSKFMQKLTTGYTMYFNLKNERTGALFQGTFKMRHADNDRYLKYLISYIHLNPVKLIDPKWKKAGLRSSRIARRFLNAYSYSSFLDYVGEHRIENCIVNREALPYDFSPEEFRNEIFEWLERGEENN